MGDEFKLYIIHSKYSLEKISGIFKLHTSSGLNIGPIRKDYIRDNLTKEYYDNNTRFALINESIYDSLIESKYEKMYGDNFIIKEYEIRPENNVPKDSVPNFYFPMGSDILLDVMSKMKFIDETGMISPNDYHVHDCIVEFSNNVTEKTRTLIKIAIDEKTCRMSWCKKFAYKKLFKYF